ncbi:MULTISPECIES: hypothetical protein [Desulfosediminicola]|uniref:hypothetical protein n=1 Tax=Desulfosediminicola TaxID=2886823 RepID=UPI0010AC4A6E|nr:hypothetical protein [Desulfosediminicola ganghwensis]
MKSITPDQICFGLNRQLDEASFSCYLQLLGRPEFADVLAERMTSEEINVFIDNMTALLKKHLRGNEYHALFLQQQGHHSHAHSHDE